MTECPDAVLVIACGDPMRQDDGVAWHVLEGLRMLRPRPGLPAFHLRHAPQLTSDLAEPVSRAAGVVFVEGRRSGAPGERRCEPTVPSAGANPLASPLTPQALLLYAEALCGRAPQAVVIGITGERFGPGDELSPAARRALPWAIRAVVRQAKAWTSASAGTTQTV